MTRIIQKGNVKDDNYYDLRIIEENGDIYYYHFLQLVDGCSIIPTKPFNFNSMEEISWDDLPIKLRNQHYNNIYPNSNSNSYERNCFLYGKERADEIKKSIIQEEENIYNVIYHIKVNKATAIEICNKIGKLEKVKILLKECNWIRYLVNDRWIIKTKNFKLISIEEKFDIFKQEKQWGYRIKDIAEQANVSFDMATVVGNITDTDEAINILKEIVKIVNSEKFYNEFEFKFRIYEKIEKRSFELFLSQFLSQEQIKKLNWSKRFQSALAIILKNK